MPGRDPDLELWQQAQQRNERANEMLRRRRCAFCLVRMISQFLATTLKYEKALVPLLPSNLPIVSNRKLTQSFFKSSYVSWRLVNL